MTTERFNYFAAIIFTILINVPFYVFAVILGFEKMVGTFSLPVAFALLVFIPVAAKYFLKYFSGGINLKNGLIFGIILSIGSLVFDYLFYGLAMGEGIAFLSLWIFSVTYVFFLILTPFWSYVLDRGSWILKDMNK